MTIEETKSKLDALFTAVVNVLSNFWIFVRISRH